MNIFGRKDLWRSHTTTKYIPCYTVERHFCEWYFQKYFAYYLANVAKIREKYPKKLVP